MDFIVWSEDYSVGYETIDRQHKKMIELINDLFKSLQNSEIRITTETIISELTEYIEWHFSEEEMLFVQFNYSEAEEHIKEHNDFITRVTEMFNLYHEDSKALLENISGFLHEWLINHILHTDMIYKGRLQA